MTNIANYMKGLARVISYRDTGEIVSIYEGRLDGDKRFDQFGRVIM